MILSVGGIKGGSGKTTIAVNIAVSKALEGKKVLLVDGDNQKSSLKWSIARSANAGRVPLTVVHLSESAVLTQVRQMSPDYDEVIIDVGGRDTTSLRASMLVCDKFLTPFRPRSFDIWTVEDIENILREALLMNPKIKPYAVINQADPRGVDNQEAKRILNKSSILKTLDAVICQRKTFANSSSEGLGILEHNPIDKKAEKEMRSAIQQIYKKYIKFI